ncbi:unnamed protein product [Closterium sp. NIES-54]
MSFYEQHQQAAPAQSNNSDNNNGVTPMSLDGSSFARGNQQPTFALYEPQRGSVSFMPNRLPPGQETKTLDALQLQTAQALYDAVVTRYSSPATAALGRLLLPYLFPELSDFATVEDLVSHLRTSDTRYRASVPADAVAVGAAHGTPRPPFFDGCSPSPLAPSYTSATAADVSVGEDVGASSTSAKRRSSKGKGGRGGGGGGSASGGGGSKEGGGGSGCQKE